MKTIRFFTVALLALTGFTVSAQEKMASFKVSGNCSMCKKRIETAAKIPGVNSIEWHVKTKIAKVSFDPEKVSIETIQKKIAEAGHDSENFKTLNGVYHNLPTCCQYDRTTQPVMPGSKNNQ